jgi:hypothetical protein
LLSVNGQLDSHARVPPPGIALSLARLRAFAGFGLPLVAQAASELMKQGAPAFESAVPILSQLLKAETAEREVRSVAY